MIQVGPKCGVSIVTNIKSNVVSAYMYSIRESYINVLSIIWPCFLQQFHLFYSTYFKHTSDDLKQIKICVNTSLDKFSGTKNVQKYSILVHTLYHVARALAMKITLK